MAVSKKKVVDKVVDKSGNTTTTKVDVEFNKRDRMDHAISRQADVFKKKFGNKWQAIANGIIHVHSTHRKDFTSDK